GHHVVAVQIELAAIEVEYDTAPEGGCAAEPHGACVQIEPAPRGRAEAVIAGKRQGTRAELGDLRRCAEDVVGHSQIVAAVEDQSRTAGHGHIAVAEAARGPPGTDLQDPIANAGSAVTIRAGETGGSQSRDATRLRPRAN